MKTLDIGVLCEIIDNHSGSRAPLEIASHLAALNQKVTIYAYDYKLNRRAKADLKRKNVKVILIKKPNIPFIGKYAGAITLLKILRTRRHQIMTYCAMFPFFLAGILSGTPIVRIYQGTQFDALLERKLPGEKLNLFEKVTNFFANIYIYSIELTTTHFSKGIVAISKYAKKEAEKLYFKKVDRVIYLGTTYLGKSQSGSKPKKKYSFISVSRITPYKGFHLIIKALNKLKTKNINYVIVGSQPKKKYQQYLKKIGYPFVKLVINPPDRELANLYRTSKIYLNADRHQYFGLTLTEAALYGLPTVSFDFAASRELIDDNKSGFIAKNEAQFTKAVEKLLKNPKLMRKMGSNARIKAQKEFTWRNTTINYLSLLNKIVNENK